MQPPCSRRATAVRPPCDRRAAARVAAPLPGTHPAPLLPSQLCIDHPLGGPATRAARAGCAVCSRSFGGREEGDGAESPRPRLDLPGDIRVLIGDDDSMCRRLLKRAFERHCGDNWKVRAAMTAAHPNPT